MIRTFATVYLEPAALGPKLTPLRGISYGQPRRARVTGAPLEAGGRLRALVKPIMVGITWVGVTLSFVSIVYTIVALPGLL